MNGFYKGDIVTVEGKGTEHFVITLLPHYSGSNCMLTGAYDTTLTLNVSINALTLYKAGPNHPVEKSEVRKVAYDADELLDVKLSFQEVHGRLAPGAVRDLFGDLIAECDNKLRELTE